MAEIVVTGGGVGGLSAAMLLAEDGHDVTLLERDGAEPPPPTEAWESWERRGVNQFRLLHFFMPRFRLALEQELPHVAKALEAAGALRLSLIGAVPETLTGGTRPGDGDFESLTGRRPVIEAVMGAAAASTPGVTVRRGVAVAGLVAGAQAIRGVPHITGVRTAAGEEIAADLVVDATGRRSALPDWLEAAGARRPVEELEDSGFVYYGRHFRSAERHHAGRAGTEFAGLWQCVDPHAAGRQRHLGGGGDRQCRGPCHAGSARHRALAGGGAEPAVGRSLARGRAHRGPGRHHVQDRGSTP